MADGIDQGGMNYKITVQDQGSAEVANFRNELRQARNELRAFKAELSGRGAAADAQARRLDALAKAGSRAVTATMRQAAAEKNATVKHNQRTQAILDQNRAFDRKVRADNAASVSADRNFATERRIASATRQRAQAEAAITKVLEQRAQAQLRLQAATERNVTLTDRERRALGLLNDQQRRVLAARERLTRQQAEDSPEVARINAETEALRRRNRAQLEANTEALLAAQGLDKNGKALTRPEDTGLRQRIKDFIGLGNSIKGADGHANRAAFTFRRLFGILAAFAAARALGNLFTNAIREGIQFNAVMERSRLGIAGILAAAGEVRNEFGRTTDAGTRLNIALGIADNQIEKLKLDALTTTATFEDMVDAFQTGLAPGLQAGFDVDQIRRFTREISLAASAIGLDQRQLSEEIRSILTGTINPRNTRIAAALGITNDDIRNAQETGKLFEFLQGKFAAFDAAGKKAAQTLPGLFERLKDALQQLLGAGLKPFTDDLKGLLGEVVDLIVLVDNATGKVSINPELIAIIAEIGKGLKTIIEEFKAIGQAVGIQGFQELAKSIGALITFIARAFGGIIQGAIQGVQFVLGLLVSIRNVIQNITGFDILDPTVLRTVLVIFSAIAAATLTITLLLSAISPILKIINVAFAGLRLTIFAISGLIKGVTVAMRGLQTAAAAVGLATSPLLGTFLALAAAIGAVVFAYAALSKQLDISNTTQTNFWAREIARLEILTRRMFEEKRVKDSRGFFVVDPKDVAETTRQLRDLDAAFDREAQSEEDLTKVVGDKIKSLFGDLKKLAGDTGKEADELAKKMKFEGFLIANSEAIAELRDRLKELKDQAREASDAAHAAILSIGLQSDAGRIISAAEAARLDAAREAKKLDIERVQVLKQLAQIEADFELVQNKDSEEFNQLLAKQFALRERLNALDQTRLKLAEAIFRVKAAELLQTAREAAFQLQQENAVSRIEASNARALRLAELTGNARELAVLTAKQELDIAVAKNAQEEETARLSINALRAQVEMSRQRLAMLEAINEQERSVEDNIALADAREIVVALNAQADALQEQANIQRQIREEEIARLQRNKELADLQQQSPIGTGIVEGFVQSFQQVSDAFKVTVDIMTRTIQSFAQFAAASIVDAFDPTNDTSILENFARFLQQLATLILETLIQLAITAAALNLASGGLLGPLLQKYAKAQGFHDGGQAEGRHDGGRALRSHRHARGYADGGQPTARGVHGVIRPSTGLHPADTVPIWADPTEWIVRGSSVRKAGADALAIINEGAFDPLSLRAALGLRTFARASTRIGRRGMGFVDGGPASSARSILGVQTGTTQSRPSQGTSVLTVDPNTANVLARGGENAQLRMLASRGIFPTSRSGNG